MRRHPVAGPAIVDWLALFEGSSFRGITTDGTVIPGLFPLGPEEGAPAAAVSAANSLLEHLGSMDRERLTHPLNSKLWRAWMNPDFYLNRFGLRLEELDDGTRELAMADAGQPEHVRLREGTCNQAGVWLGNSEPEPFHIHVLVCTPNGNDHGADQVRAATGQEQQLDRPV